MGTQKALVVSKALYIMLDSSKRLKILPSVKWAKQGNISWVSRAWADQHYGASDWEDITRHEHSF